MADPPDPFVAHVEVDGVPQDVPLLIPGNDAYERVVAEAAQNGRSPRPPTQEEVARAIEAWRRQQGALGGFRKERRPTEVRTLYPERRW